MFGHMVLLAAMIGQTSDSPRMVPGLSEQARMAQARALATFRANEHTIKPRLTTYYQLENDRLGRRVHTLDVATERVGFLTAGASTASSAIRGDGFSSIPPSGPVASSGNQDRCSLDDVRRDNFLLKGELRDSRFLYRQANSLYLSEYPIRYQRACWGMR
jgi:hypothetical protein